MPIRKGPGVPYYHEIGKRRPRPRQFNSLPVRGHSGNTAYMAFYSSRNYPLPRLFAFAIYFTRPDASPDHVNQKGLLNALMNGSTRFRLELFFLPGANEEDCMKHYRGEKEVYGDYHAQITIMEESNPDQDFSPDCGQLPGLVPSYTECGELNHYHLMPFICKERNWTDGKQIVRMVEFDPVSAEEWAPFWDPDGPTRPAEKWVTVWPINKESPSYREDKSSVQEEMLENSIIPCEEVTSQPWREANERGWMS